MSRYCGGDGGDSGAAAGVEKSVVAVAVLRHRVVGLCGLLWLRLCGGEERGRIADCSSRVGAGGVEGGFKRSGIAVSARCAALAGAKVQGSVIVVVVTVGLLVFGCGSCRIVASGWWSWWSLRCAAVVWWQVM